MHTDSNLGGPEHADASRRFPVIPNEIFLEIFGYIQVSVELEYTEYRHILSRLSLVCAFFCTTLRPRLFGWLVLGKGPGSPGLAFCQALMRGNVRARALAVHIRGCSISHGVPADSEMCHQILHWVPNVEFLQFIDSSDIGFWGIIGKLSKLKTLDLYSMSFRDGVPAGGIDCVVGLRVSSLGIFNSKALSLLQVLNLTVLSRLHCDPNSLSTLLAGGPIGTLETLTISSSEESVSPWSLDILSKVPSIRNLTIFTSATEGLEFMTQDFSALLPNLHSLTCGSPLLFLASGRPLVSLHVLDEGGPVLDLGAILGSRGLNTIADLVIPSTIYPTGGHCFPHLRNLALEFPSYIDELENPGPEADAKLTTLIIDSCNKWVASPTIERLRITVCAGPPLVNLALQHTVLSGSLTPKFPALRRFQLGNEVEWERFGVDEAWRVLVPIWRQASIVVQFEAGSPGVVDHDGYLQRLSARDVA
ncbi:hypothetical protein BD779DRAFT_1671435 [Infundibulicybe gibba]|nr:hypothetical protein BD779DRAFT_1671435 [Infundibulicybe gibba]